LYDNAVKTKKAHKGALALIVVFKYIYIYLMCVNFISNL